MIALTIIALSLAAALLIALEWGLDWRDRAERAERECGRYRNRARVGEWKW